MKSPKTLSKNKKYLKSKGQDKYQFNLTAETLLQEVQSTILKAIVINKHQLDRVAQTIYAQPLKSTLKLKM